MKRKLSIILIIILVLLIIVGGSLIAFFNSNYYYSRKLISAIRENNIVEVQKIIDKKPTCINTFPSITSKWWHSAMNWRFYYPLNVACSHGNISIIELLIENGANVNCNDGFTPLAMTYSSKGKNWYEVSLILIENGASLNYCTEYSGNYGSVLQDIVSVGYHATSIEYDPETEKVIAAFNYALENCDHSNICWMTVLQHSVSNDRIEIVKLLLDEGYCDVNDTSIEMTALMFAARDSTPEMTRLLLEYGADISYIDYQGKTAYDYALQSNNEEIISMLEKAQKEQGDGSGQGDGSAVP